MLDQLNSHVKKKEEKKNQKNSTLRHRQKLTQNGSQT